MHIGWPQGIVLFLFAMGLGLSLGLHGKPNGNVNFFYKLLGTGLMATLLWWGGFFA